MKKGSEGSAAACSIPASRQRRDRPPREAREPAVTISPSRRATASRSSTRTAQPSGSAKSGDAWATQALCRLGLVDGCDQLEVCLAKRHDPVGRPPARVPAALERGQAVAFLELAPGRREVGHGDQDVVELHRGERRDDLYDFTAASA
jgi:hypothetical protein